MLKRVRRHLSPPMVVSVIALFAALGGGYAMAFSGSGSLQKGAANNLGGTFQTVRALTGVGSIQGRCVNDADDEGAIRFVNESGESLRIRTFDWRTSEYGDDFLAEAQAKSVGIPPEQSNEIDLRINPSDSDPTTGKAPQVIVRVSATNFTTNCTNFDFHVLALNTEE